MSSPSWVTVNATKQLFSRKNGDCIGINPKWRLMLPMRIHVGWTKRSGWYVGWNSGILTYPNRDNTHNQCFTFSIKTILICVALWNQFRGVQRLHHIKFERPNAITIWFCLIDKYRANLPRLGRILDQSLWMKGIEETGVKSDGHGWSASKKLTNATNRPVSNIMANRKCLELRCARVTAMLFYLAMDGLDGFVWGSRQNSSAKYSISQEQELKRFFNIPVWVFLKIGNPQK